MTGSITRKQFLRFDFTNQHAPLRPPWSVMEHLFIEACTGCANCIDNCPEKILFAGSGNYPEVDFSKGECFFCYECVKSCNDQALTGSIDSIPWNIKANITEQCLAFSGIHCMTCRDQCETEAITFTHSVSRPPYPTINPLLCNGCGACYQPCPNQSIKLNYQSTNESDKSSHLKETAL